MKLQQNQIVNNKEQVVGNVEPVGAVELVKGADGVQVGSVNRSGTKWAASTLKGEVQVFDSREEAVLSLFSVSSSLKPAEGGGGDGE